jgi:hypothetical protein
MADTGLDGVSDRARTRGYGRAYRDTEINPPPKKKLRGCQWRGYTRTDRHKNMKKPRLFTFIYTVYSETNYSIR